MAEPSIGRVVIAVVAPVTNNGADLAPAVITRVWDQRPDGSWTVNVKVNLDQHGNRWLTSVPLFDTEEDARAHGVDAAFWPARAGA